MATAQKESLPLSRPRNPLYLTRTKCRAQTLPWKFSSGLKPAFHVKGTVTAGNSSPMSDGAAAVVVMSDAKAAQLGLKPQARFVSYATAGCPPEEFGIGPVYAIPKALNLAGLSLNDLGGD